MSVISSLVELGTKRYVRDGNIIISNDEHRFYKEGDYLLIEEIKSFSFDTGGIILPDTALLTRNVFDYLKYLKDNGINYEKEYVKVPIEERRKPTQLKYVGRRKCDLSKLVLKFDENSKQYMFCSKTEDGENLFTVSLDCDFNGSIKMTAPEKFTGRVKMYHAADESLSDMLDKHMNLTTKGKILKRNLRLHEGALETFNKIMEHSERFSEI